MSLPIYELKINEEIDDEAEVKFVALVDAPAIRKGFIAFKEDFVSPNKDESKDDFMSRCISYVVNEGKEQEQAIAICQSLWSEHFVSNKVSFDYDETLNTKEGKQLALKEIESGSIVYIISARSNKKEMMNIANELGIPSSNVFATGSNEEKIAKVKELGINKHYDNNADVVSALGNIGQKFEETYDDYPKEASENAKIALNWAEKNGWGSCGEATGKRRASMLANREKLSRDTIARMSSFERHRQNSKRELGDGCGRLMWLAWGGDAGIEWAKRKLEQIDKKAKMSSQQFQIVNEEQRIISGPLMLADELIFRQNESFGQHYVVFSAETIKQIAIKFAKKGYQKNVNLMHDAKQKVEGVTMFESFIVDKSRGIMPMKDFREVADGSWFGSFYVENDEVWSDIKNGKFFGFSVEGMFEYNHPMTAEENALKKISSLLNELNEE